jgi:hypothetical protein
VSEDSYSVLTYKEKKKKRQQTQTNLRKEAAIEAERQSGEHRPMSE